MAAPREKTDKPPAPREKSAVKAICALLRARGIWHVKTHGAGAGRAGIPDILACVCGRFVAFEVKRSHPCFTKTKARQRVECAAIAAACGYAFLVCDKRDVDLAIDYVMGDEIGKKGVFAEISVDSIIAYNRLY